MHAVEQPVERRRGERKGDFLGGKYLLGDCLGVGGMGEVYRATNVSLGRNVAIKVLSSKFVNREEDVLRFLREARAAAAVRHLHVVDVLDVARDDDGTPFIVQELLDGEDLEQYLRARKGRLACDEALEIMIPVADAVAAAHLQQVVHRDLKPANIFLARERNKITPKVLDFGACIFPTMGDLSKKEANLFIGTPHYMAPEQIVSNAPVDARSDVWALGIILWEIIVGETPFEAATPTEVLKLVKSRPVPPLRQRVPEAPPELELLIARCTARDPLARHADAATLHKSMLEVRRKIRGDGANHLDSLGGMPAVRITAKTPGELGSRVPSLDTRALKLTLNDPTSVPPSAFEESEPLPMTAAQAAEPYDPDNLQRHGGPRNLDPFGDESGLTQQAPLELSARPSSWPPHMRRRSTIPPVLDPASSSAPLDRMSSLPPVLAPSNARSAVSSLPPVLAPSQALHNRSSSPPPSMREAPPPSEARPGPPAILASAANPRAKLNWTGASIAGLFATVCLPAVAAFAVVRSVPALGRPVGSALRGDSTFASGVLAVVALLVAAALCARSFLGQRSRWLYVTSAASVLFGIVMIIVTFAASEAAQLGLPAAMGGVSTFVAPIGPFIIGLSSLLTARTRWLDPYSRREAVRSGLLASAMLFLMLVLGPVGVVRMPTATPAAQHH